MPNWEGKSDDKFLVSGDFIFLKLYSSWYMRTKAALTSEPKIRIQLQTSCLSKTESGHVISFEIFLLVIAGQEKTVDSKDLFSLPLIRLKITPGRSLRLEWILQRKGEGLLYISTFERSFYRGESCAHLCERPLQNELRTSSEEHVEFYWGVWIRSQPSVEVGGPLGKADINAGWRSWPWML